MIQIKSAADEWVFEPSPCEDCPHTARCRQGLACAAFTDFYKFGGRGHRKLPREPSADQYQRLFHEVVA